MDDLDEYLKNLRQKYLGVFNESFSDLINRISGAKLVERFLNEAYSNGIVSFDLIELLSTSGVPDHKRASDLMRTIAGNLRDTADYGRVQSTVLKIFKILLTLDDPVMSETLKGIMGKLNEVPEVIATSLCKSKFETSVKNIPVPFEWFYAEDIIQQDATTVSELYTAACGISKTSLLHGLVVKAISIRTSKFVELTASIRTQGPMGLSLANQLEKELRECKKVFPVAAITDEGSVFSDVHHNKREAQVSTQKVRMPSDVEPKIDAMFSKYDDLIYNIGNLFSEANEQDPQNEIHSLQNIKNNLKASRYYWNSRDKIESFTSVREVIYFAAQQNTSLLNVQHLQWLVERFKITQGQEKIDDYQSDLKRFKENTRADLINNKRISKAILSKTETIEFTIAKELGTVLMNEIEEIIDQIFEEELPEYVTVKVVSRTKSITFICHAPESIMQLLIMKAQKNLQTLIQDIGLMSLKIGYCTLLDFKPTPALSSVQVKTEEAHKEFSDTPVKIQREEEDQEKQLLEQLKKKNELYLSQIAEKLQLQIQQNIAHEGGQQDDYLETIEKFKKENEELWLKVKRREDLMTVIQQRKKENEILQKSLEECKKEKDKSAAECESVKQKMELMTEDQLQLKDTEEINAKKMKNMFKELEQLQGEKTELLKLNENLSAAFKNLCRILEEHKIDLPPDIRAVDSELSSKSPDEVKLYSDLEKLKEIESFNIRAQEGNFIPIKYRAHIFFEETGRNSWNLELVAVQELNVHTKYVNDHLSSRRKLESFEFYFLDQPDPAIRFEFTEEQKNNLPNGWFVKPLAIPCFIPKEEVDTLSIQEQRLQSNEEEIVIPDIPTRIVRVFADSSCTTSHMEYQMGIEGIKDTKTFCIIRQLDQTNVYSVLAHKFPSSGLDTYFEGVQQKELNLDNVNEVLIALTPVYHMWDKLGRYLNIPDGIITSIANKYNNDTLRQMSDLISTWIRRPTKEHHPSWKVLCQALEKMGEPALAEMITIKYKDEDITDFKKFKSLLIDQINHELSGLHSLFSFRDNLEMFANRLFQNGMISPGVRSNPDFDTLMGEIRTSLRFKRKPQDVIEHCRKFLRIMSEIGVPQKDAASSIAEDMEEVTLKEFNVTIKFYEQ